MVEENTSIHFADLFQQRDTAQAVKELRECTTVMGETLEALGMAFPGTVAIAAITGGKVRGVFALAPSMDGDHCSSQRVALDRMKTWAHIFGNMPLELRSAFEAELATIPRRESRLNYVTPEQIAADDEARLSDE